MFIAPKIDQRREQFRGCRDGDGTEVGDKTAIVLRNYTVPPLHHPAQKLVMRDSRHLPARPACRFELHHVMVE